MSRECLVLVLRGLMIIIMSRLRLLFLRTQKAHFKTTNIKKLDVAVKVYGALLQNLSCETQPSTLENIDLHTKVVEKLANMLSHPFPRVRERVVEELWIRCGIGKALDVTVKSLSKDEIRYIKQSCLVPAR